MNTFPSESIPSDPHLSGAPVLLLDCQTSGASPKNSHLLEIAWRVLNSHRTKLEAQERDTVFSTIVQLPEGCDLSSRVTSLTGITQAEAATAMPAAMVAERLRDVVKKVQESYGFVVIHFARFEKVFIDRLWADFYKTEAFDVPVLCTHLLSKRLYPEFAGYGIRAVAGYFGMTMVDHKRASTHVAATAAVWEGIQKTLLNQGIHTLREVTALLAAPQKRPKMTREYRIPKDKRLGLPASPGVYSYYGKSGAVLYVGKATSLKSRVNSYFRRQRGGDSRKNEMLMQAWDLKTEVTATPLEAALREFNLIQQLSPPYNMALRRKPEALLYFCKKLEHPGENQTSTFPLGPFDDRFGMRDLWALTNWLRSLNAPDSKDHAAKIPDHLSYVFFGLDDIELLRAGFLQFCATAGIDQTDRYSNRILAISGLGLLREKWSRIKAEADAETLFKKRPKADPEEETEEQDGQEPQEETEEQEKIWTAEDVAIKTAYIARSAAQATIEARWLRRLQSCQVRFRPGPKANWRILTVVDGEIVEPENSTVIPNALTIATWSPLGLARFRTIVQELRRVLARNGEVEVLPSIGPVMRGKRLTALLAMGF